MIVQPHLQYQKKNKKNIAAPTLKSTNYNFSKFCPDGAATDNSILSRGVVQKEKWFIQQNIVSILVGKTPLATPLHVYAE